MTHDSRGHAVESADISDQRHENTMLNARNNETNQPYVVFSLAVSNEANHIFLIFFRCCSQITGTANRKLSRSEASLIDGKNIQSTMGCSSATGSRVGMFTKLCHRINKGRCVWSTI